MLLYHSLVYICNIIVYKIKIIYTLKYLNYFFKLGHATFYIIYIILSYHIIIYIYIYHFIQAFPIKMITF